jgi:hypothetical protein
MPFKETGEDLKTPFSIAPISPEAQFKSNDELGQLGDTSVWEIKAQDIFPAGPDKV